MSSASTPGPGSPSSDGHEEELESILFETLERIESEGSAAVESAFSDHPEHEVELRRRLDALRSMGLVELPDTSGPLELPAAVGPYQLGAPLGEGGMGVVFSARDSALQREVAIKLIRQELVARGSILGRFQREARALARLQHPGVVRVIEAGQAAGVPFLAMERVQGCTLAKALDVLQGRAPSSLSGADLWQVVADQASGEPAPPEETSTRAICPWVSMGWSETVTRILRDVAEGLEQAHGAGILHRDIKASNVMLTPSGRALLIDFGLAWIDSSATLTASRGRLGSLPYTAPEQIVSPGAPTAAGDVYSLGVVLYEALTLQLPFRSSSEAGLTRAIEAGTPEPPGQVNHSVPAPIIDCVERALRRDPLRRPPTAAAFALNLSRGLKGLPPTSHGDGPLAALRSAWRAQPFVVAGVAAALVLLTALPASWLALRAQTIESTSRSTELSLERLGIAVSASEQLRMAFPVSPLLEGSYLGRLRETVERDAAALRISATEVGVELAPDRRAKKSPIDLAAASLKLNIERALDAAQRDSVGEARAAAGKARNLLEELEWALPGSTELKELRLTVEGLPQ